MENKTLRNRLSENAVKTAISRSWKSIFDALLEDYMAVINKKEVAFRSQAS